MEFGTVQYDLVAYNLSSEFLYTFFRKAAKRRIVLFIHFLLNFYISYFGLNDLE